MTHMNLVEEFRIKRECAEEIEANANARDAAEARADAAEADRDEQARRAATFQSLLATCGERARKAEAQRDALLKAIKGAPHDRTVINGVSRTCSVNRNRPCDCWKAAAIKEASHE